MAHVIQFVRQLRVEPYIFVYVFSYTISLVTASLLLQDKICRQEFGQSKAFCTNLSHVQPADDPNDYKSQILARSSQYSLYTTLISTVPAFIWSLFMGAWTDKYIHARKILMCLIAIGGVIESIVIMVNAYYFDSMTPEMMLIVKLPSSMVGGLMVMIMAVYGYTSVNSSQEMRSIRFTVMEACFFLGSPLGTFIGGQLLDNTPDGPNGQLHNYNSVFIVSLISYAAGFFWILIFVNEKDKSGEKQLLVKKSKPASYSEVAVVSPGQLQFTNRDINSNSLCPSHEEATDTSFCHNLRSLVDLNNITDVWNTCTKPRPNRVRLQIWLLFLSMCCTVTSLAGLTSLVFPYVEKVFDWDATKYSTYLALASIANSIVMILSVPILVRMLKVNDCNLTIIGTLSLFLCQAIRGSFQNTNVFYLSILVGAIHGIGSIGIRSRMSKIVSENELGKVFSLLSTLESLVPTISNALFTVIFTHSIEFWPGLVFEVAAAFLIIPIVAMVCIELCTYQHD